MKLSNLQLGIWGLASALAITGCSVDVESGTRSDDIVDIDHTEVKEQSIGNCWVYATTSWAESLHLSHTGQVANYSESWISYWHWYEEIVGSANVEPQIARLSGGELATGGWWGIAGEIWLRYGVMDEGAFIPEEADEAESRRQAGALRAIERSLESGVLSDPANRQNRALVRSVLDDAWDLDRDVRDLMDHVFGADVSYTLYEDRDIPADSGLQYASDIPVGSDVDDPTIGVSLADALGTPRSWYSITSREGRYAWNRQWTPYGDSARRQHQIKMQRALHKGLPVIMAWYVDFNAMENGAFVDAPATTGRSGGHMTPIEDYEITNVPGYGTLEAGTLVTDENALDAALDEDAEISFIRVKNSWGDLTPPQGLNNFTGYHDVYTDYLYSGLCRNDECSSTTLGLWAFVLPPATFSTDPVQVDEPVCELAHDICVTGQTLDASCDRCVDQICAFDPYCCNNYWDGICVGEVESICEQTCD